MSATAASASLYSFEPPLVGAFAERTNVVVANPRQRGVLRKAPRYVMVADTTKGVATMRIDGAEDFILLCDFVLTDDDYMTKDENATAPIILRWMGTATSASKSVHRRKTAVRHRHRASSRGSSRQNSSEYSVSVIPNMSSCRFPGTAWY